MRDLARSIAIVAAVWTVQQPTAPPAMYSRAAVYDPVRAHLLVVGGYFNGRNSSDTWSLKSGRWTLLPGDGPAARAGSAITFDIQRARVVLFGGDAGGAAFGDTWEHDGVRWTKVSERGPSPRTLARMTYDSARRRAVLYGGLTRGASGRPDTPAGDTWEWDGAAWTERTAAGPGPRFLHAMSYDTTNRITVLFGGGGAMPPAADDPRGDTWEWNGAAWRRVEGPSPPPRDHAAMAFDAIGHRLLLVGGSAGPGGSLGDTWARQGSTWSRIDVTGLPAIAGHTLFFDNQSRGLRLFGGFAGPEPWSALWTLEGRAWIKAAR